MSRYTIVHNDVLKWAKQYDGAPFMALLTDPPYELGFMGKDWEKSGIAFQPETWAALAEHLLPGAFGMAFASARGWHRLACAIEDAGLRIHPSIFLWAFGSGFPKATRIDTQIDKAAGAEREIIGFSKWHSPGRKKAWGNGVKYGTCKATAEGHDGKIETAPATPLAKAWAGHRYGLQALKPAVEPIIVFQRKYEGKPVDSIVKTGAGALNIDGARIGTPPPSVPQPRFNSPTGLIYGFQSGVGRIKQMSQSDKGRWPANFVLDEEAARRLGRQSGITNMSGPNTERGWSSNGKGDTGTAARFFLNVDWKLEQSDPVLYCPKASRKERDAGLERRNDHPTLKPIKLTQWLATLLLPPKEYAPRRILIPFAGSGSEMIGALRAGWEDIIGIELEEEYCKIAEARLKYWAKQSIQIPLTDA